MPSHKSLIPDLIELSGSDLYVDRCRRLLECSDMLVQFQTPNHSIAVWGSELTASDYSAHGLHIHGRIAVIEFDGGLHGMEGA